MHNRENCMKNCKLFIYADDSAIVTFFVFSTRKSHYFVSLSFSEEIFLPWNIAKLHLCLKTGNRKYITDLSSMILLSIFRKLLCKFDLFLKLQYGFSKCKSHNWCNNKFVDFVLNNLENNTNVMSIFLNLLKTFNWVEFQKLFNILGRSGLPLSWIKSFMYGRTKELRWQGDCQIRFRLNLGYLKDIFGICFIYSLYLGCHNFYVLTNL